MKKMLIVESCATCPANCPYPVGPGPHGGIHPDCPLDDAPDPERYQRAVLLLKEMLEYLEDEDEGQTTFAEEITAFLAGEDGG